MLSLFVIHGLDPIKENPIGLLHVEKREKISLAVYTLKSIHVCGAHFQCVKSWSRKRHEVTDDMKWHLESAGAVESLAGSLTPWHYCCYRVTVAIKSLTTCDQWRFGVTVVMESIKLIRSRKRHWITNTMESLTPWSWLTSLGHWHYEVPDVTVSYWCHGGTNTIESPTPRSCCRHGVNDNMGSQTSFSLWCNGVTEDMSFLTPSGTWE